MLLLQIDYGLRVPPLLGWLGRLPRITHLSGLCHSGGIASILRLIDTEMALGAVGQRELLERLVESFFVYVMRAALAVDEPLTIDDALIAKALTVLYAEPAEKWT